MPAPLIKMPLADIFYNCRQKKNVGKNGIEKKGHGAVSVLISLLLLVFGSEGAAQAPNSPFETTKSIVSGVFTGKKNNGLILVFLKRQIKAGGARPKFLKGGGNRTFKLE